MALFMFPPHNCLLLSGRQVVFPGKSLAVGTLGVELLLMRAHLHCVGGSLPLVMKGGV